VGLEAHPSRPSKDTWHARNKEQGTMKELPYCPALTAFEDQQLGQPLYLVPTTLLYYKRPQQQPIAEAMEEINAWG